MFVNCTPLVKDTIRCLDHIFESMSSVLRRPPVDDPKAAVVVLKRAATESGGITSPLASVANPIIVINTN